MKNLKESKAITLIALIITIIVLLILAGVVINMTLGNDGILAKASKAKDITNYNAAYEKVNFAIFASYGDNGELNEELLLKNINNIQGLESKLFDINLPITIYVDGYEFQITKNGEVKQIERKFPSIKLSVDYNNLDIYLLVDEPGDEIINAWIYCNEVSLGKMEQQSELLFKGSIQDSGKYNIKIETEFETQTFSIDVYNIEKLNYPLLTKDGIFNYIVYDEQNNIASYVLKTGVNYSQGDYVSTNGYNGNLSNYDTVSKTTKKIKVDSSIWGKDIVVNLVSMSGSAGDAWWNYIYFYNEKTNSTTEYASFKTESTVTWTNRVITIPQGTTEIRFKAANYYFQIKDIYANNLPKFSSNLVQYPIITKNKVNKGYSELNIKYDEFSAIKLFKINNEEWRIYQGDIKLNFGDTLYAKSINNIGIETRVSQYMFQPQDILKDSAFNSDLSNYDTVSKTTKKIKVDSSIWGKDIVVNLVSMSGSAGDAWWNYIYFYNEKTNSTTEYASFKTESTVTWTDRVITIPQGTTEIRFKAANYYFQIKDIDIYDSPKIKYVNYPVIRDEKIDFKIYCTIDYFDTSIQKFYKVNNGEWNEYKENEIIYLNENDTIYAKGINTEGKETYSVSNYKALKATDALGINAYNNELNNYETISKTTKKIKVDSSMWGKDIVVNLVSMSGSADDAWWNYIYFYNEKTNSTTEYASFKTESTVTWTDRVITIPQGTTEIRFKAANYYFQIKNIAIKNN